MAREPTKSDYTEEELANLRSGRCWCGVPRPEFAKGLRVYCSIKHREEWYGRTISWSGYRDEIMGEREKRCVHCGLDDDGLEKKYAGEMKKWKRAVLKDPRVREQMEARRIEMLNRVEELYAEAMDDWGLARQAVRGFGYYDSSSGWPEPHRAGFEVDHIVAVALGGDMWDKKNLQILCTACHRAKTAKDVGKIKQRRHQGEKQ